MKNRLDRETIALRVAREYPDGAVVNLGIGIGAISSELVSEDRTVFFMSENGILGFGKALRQDEMNKADACLISASGNFVVPKPGMSVFDSAEAFAMIRGGHIDITVLGAYQVSEKGDLANWIGPDGLPSVGGAMDLAAGAGQIWVAMEHTTKDGKPKIVKQCSIPLTRKECVSLIFTDLAVIEVTKEGLLLREAAPGWTPEEIQSLTEPKLTIRGRLKEMQL